MLEQYYQTRDTKLAVAIATLEVPFHDPLAPCTSVQEAGGLQTTWRFKLDGVWRNMLSGETCIVRTDHIGIAWGSPNSGKLQAGPRVELLLMKRALENRELLQQAARAKNMDVRYVGEAIRENVSIMQRIMLEGSLSQLKTRAGRLFVPSLHAREHFRDAEKAFGIKCL